MKANYKSFCRKNRGSILVFGFFIFVRATLANEYVVPSGSMEPTIAIGDRIFVNRTAFDIKFPLSNIILKSLHEPKPGSIVVFESPKEAGLVLVKRLIAVPGDEVEIKNGFVFINQQATVRAVESPTLYQEAMGQHLHWVQRLPELYHPDYFHFVVPAGHYFMMGDNRDNSADGRVFGLVARELLIGEVKGVIFSVNFSRPLSEMVAWNRFGKALI